MQHTPSRKYEYKKVTSNSRVGRLLVLKVVGRSKGGSLLWLCICDCGNTCEAVSSSLNKGLKQSCGCLYNEIKGKQKVTHGRSKTREYNSWMAMKERCYNSKTDYYHLYGGRGITVCEEWKHSFESFYSAMGDCPKGMSLDRIDSNGNYEPGNCRWSTPSVQGFNTRKRISNSSGRTGVTFHSKQGVWHSYITVNYKRIHLGSFRVFEEAVKERELAEIKYYGYNKE